MRRRFLEPVALGLLAAAALYAPPLQIATRIDRALFDLWSQLDSRNVPADIVLVDVEDTPGLTALATLGEQQHAALVVSTIAAAPASRPNLIGPLHVPLGSAQLRRTEWTRGGHLLLETDFDGVLRYDRATLSGADDLPSLAAFAAAELTPGAAPWPGIDSAGRRWLAFVPGHPYPSLSLDAVAAAPETLAGKIVIAGSTEPSVRTPVGWLSAPEAVAQALSSYRDERYIDAGNGGALAAWAAAALALVLLAARAPRTTADRWARPWIGAVLVAVVAAGAFSLGRSWLPIAGPLTWLLFTGTMIGLRRTIAAPAVDVDRDLTLARQAVTRGDLESAWSHYRQITPTATLLPELYNLACALDTAGHPEEGGDLFHRIAQLDGHFRDVAKMLAHRTPLTPADDPSDERAAMPESLGRYQLLEPIGRGAMGLVYLGRDPKINRIVALKAIDFAAEFEAEDLEIASQAFLREAEIAGRLSHPNIVTIFDVGETDGLAYIAMEYLKGKHLSDFTNPDRLLPPETVLELLSKTADALDYAHAQNVVHRDIKPANIMYDSISDGLKITDFGIARLIDVSRTRTGIVLGTPAFMSPEQLEGKNVNGHTDLFALGVSLYQLLTGQLPFRGASMTKLMFVIANEPHESITSVRPDLPKSLNAIVDRALAKDPAERFESGAEMAAALRDTIAQVA